MSEMLRGFALRNPIPAWFAALVLMMLLVYVVIGSAQQRSANRVRAADRALCDSRGGVWLTAPVPAGCYRVEGLSDGS